MSKKQIALVISGAVVLAGAAYVCFRARLKKRCELQSSLSPLTSAGIAAAASGNATAPSPSSVAQISSHPLAPVASPPPNLNFATEWLDEHGRVCPKAVDYATQCPKGHDLLPFAGGGGGAPAQRLLCRVCHAYAEHECASQWVVCSVAGCCAGYAVCDCCVSALQQAPDAASGGDDAPSAVSAAAHACA
jgi:hypothetical protein